MIRKSAYDRAGLYEEAWTRCEDYLFFVQLAASGDVRVEHIDQPLVVVYQEAGERSADRQLAEFLQYWKLLDALVERFPVARLAPASDADGDEAGEAKRLALARRRVDLIRHFKAWTHRESVDAARALLEALADSPRARIAGGAFHVRGDLEELAAGPDVALPYYQAALDRGGSSDDARARRAVARVEAAANPDARERRVVGLYLGWIGNGNLGDECMYQACAGALPAADWNVFYNETPDQIRAQLEFLARTHPDMSLRACGLLGGGTFINRHAPALTRYLNLTEILGAPPPLFGTGVASPVFWAGRDGWKDLRREWAGVLGDLDVLGVRGPHSKELLEEAGLDNVEVVGDSGLLFAREADPDRAATGVVAVNVGGSEGHVWGDDEGAIERETVALVRTLVARGLRVALVPVWTEDAVMSRRVLAACNGSAKSAVRLEEPVTDARVFLDRLAGVDALVGVKLHALVLAAAANVPMLGVAYRPKCLDFMRSIEWEAFSLTTRDFVAADVADRVEAAIAQAPALRRRLAERVGALAASFTAYCRTLEGALARVADTTGMVT